MTERAEELAKSIPAAAEMLRFYAKIARWKTTGDRRSLLELVSREGPPALAERARALARDGRSPDPQDPLDAFFVRILQVGQAFSPAGRAQARPATCPHCGSAPVVAVLRPEGEGGKRSLVCSHCSTEWPFRRLVCPNCGEEDQHKLPVYVSDEFPHVRVEACDSCHRYIKCVDLTRNGLAEPLVDEIATVALDLWAADRGYTKVQLNLLGM